ncbi:MAG: hypothetical protein AAFR76_05445 [Planctomycetota bacterium]
MVWSSADTIEDRYRQQRRWLDPALSSSGHATAPDGDQSTSCCWNSEPGIISPFHEHQAQSEWLKTLAAKQGDDRCRFTWFLSAAAYEITIGTVARASQVYEGQLTPKTIEDTFEEYADNATNAGDVDRASNADETRSRVFFLMNQADKWIIRGEARRTLDVPIITAQQQQLLLDRFDSLVNRCETCMQAVGA